MDFIQPIAAIVLVMALLAGTLLLLRRRGTASFRLPGGMPGSSARQLEVLERVSLGPQHTLHLVRADGRRILIATAPNSCQLLDGALGDERP